MRPFGKVRQRSVSLHRRNHLPSEGREGTRDPRANPERVCTAKPFFLWCTFSCMMHRWAEDESRIKNCNE